MHFDQRTQAALREVGLSTDRLREASDLVKEAARADAAALEAFFDGRGTVYSDMEAAHGPSGVREHAVEYLDLYTHAADIRGYLRFDSWGVPVEGGRPLPDGTVELTLGPTVNDRVRFADDPDDL
ncbi:hypothetical protein ACFQPA_09545 [Halomarina halobia]|uniref:Uncharacterized protein n=1 Tax=Halomarina halobia TaxID=3033386 RepID=A0ABD6ABT8_9EURY|nr:hypothetical protein [Halomarina sp. PSR21]